MWTYEGEIARQKMCSTVTDECLRAHDSLVNSCSSINQIAPPACLKKELKRKCLHIWAPPGVLKVETFVQEKMNSTISPPIYRGKRHIISRMNTDSYTISPSKKNDEIK